MMEPGRSLSWRWRTALMPIGAPDDADRRPDDLNPVRVTETGGPPPRFDTFPRFRAEEDKVVP